MTITIEDQQDALHRTVWHFMIIDSTIRLSLYEEQERQTKRHKWRAVRAWSRGGARSYLHRIVDEPEIPKPIQINAINAIIEKLTFKRW